MRIVLELPASLERVFGESGDAARAVTEAALIELYRQHRLTQGGLADALKITRTEADEILTRHGVPNDTSVQQHQEDVRQLRKLTQP